MTSDMQTTMNTDPWDRTLPLKTLLDQEMLNLMAKLVLYLKEVEEMNCKMLNYVPKHSGQEGPVACPLEERAILCN